MNKTKYIYKDIDKISCNWNCNWNWNWPKVIVIVIDFSVAVLEIVIVIDFFSWAVTVIEKSNWPQVWN